ncbi:hypothetical protein LTR56_014590 [Elasticomyces elasticus]|nr:hypothetical protein LTR56_014590 [Elasticomyces elasticus]KAK3646778.1 hypothetical protein LTR22_014154 [Elasticomyces elasticus]KAK4916379.1 hypothetical protein LTR49_015613 [Elasticomyces elasticus]
MKFPQPRLPRTFRSLELNDADSRWENEDIVPVVKDEQNFTNRAFFGYWVAAGLNTTAWALGSSNLANGLDLGGALGGIFAGGVLSGLVAFLCGEPGVRYHLGFSMMSRATFGMYGAWFVIMLKCFVNFIFFGIQAYWGGLAASVVLSSIFPSFHTMANTLPESAQITTQQLIGFIIYIFLFTPLMFIHPSRLQPVLAVSLVTTTCTVFGVFIWAVASNGGAPLVPPKVKVSSSERSFQILRAMSAVAGAWTGACIRQSDWTRYAKTRRAPAIHQLVSGPLTVTICATLGAFATSAVNSMYGKLIWNPIAILQFVLERDYDAASRAGCFFAGMGFFISQIATNLVQNSVSCGMDLASLAPRWIDVTRGSLIMCLVGYLINPWRFVNAPGTFITVLSSFGMFVSPLAGINAIDFWVVRRLRWSVPDFYIGNSESIYWFTAGLNWRAFFAWTLAVWPSFPGFIAATGAIEVSVGWERCFSVTWVIGFCGGAAVYYIVCLISPPPGSPYTIKYYDNDAMGVLDGVKDRNDNDEKHPTASIKSAGASGSS